MEENKDVLLRIKEKFAYMSKSHKTIANYVLDNYEDVAFMTAAKVGAKAGISESTVVRFATSLGYAGYPEFQKAIGERIKGKLSRMEQINQKYGNKSQSDVVSAVLASDIENLKDALARLNPDAFDVAVDSLMEAETVYIMGLRSNAPLAYFLQFYLNLVRKNVVLVNTTSMTETFEQLMRINEKDCFVGISFPRYSMRTLKAMEFANDRNAKVIAITDSVYSPMNLYSSCNLFAKSDMVSIVDSLVAPLSVINALVVAICLKKPEQVNKDLQNLEEIWGNYQVYLNDEINFTPDEPVDTHTLIKMEYEDE